MQKRTAEAVFFTAGLEANVLLVCFVYTVQGSRTEEESNGSGRGGQEKKSSGGEKTGSERGHREMQDGH